MPGANEKAAQDVAFPTWKIQRELERVAQQLSGLPEYVTDRMRRRRLDRAVAAGLPTYDGRLPVRSKVAILLIFQPQGISESTLEQCNWLFAHGYAPLIVSNAPLAAQDIERLAPLTWRTVVRPNFGYDFGGYRDALTTLSRWQVSPDTLLILNDSVWVPIGRDEDLLSRLEASPADIAGSIMRFRSETQFLESYCYRIRGRLLHEAAFTRFWADLRLTSNKYYVIRRGERGFSEAMEAAGYSIEAVFDQEDLRQRLAQQDMETLAKTIRYAAFFPEDMIAERDALLSDAGDGDDEAWRGRALSLIDRTLEKRLAYSTLPYASCTLMRYPFLKKSKDRVAVQWRQAYAAAVEAGDLPEPGGAILAELQAQLRKDAAR